MILAGVALGIVKPSDIANSDAIGFNDVANAGFNIQTSARWFYSARLSLGCFAEYSFLPQNNEFWNTRNYGTVNNYYRMIQLGMQGHYYFSHKEFMPYTGIGFGANFLMNQLDYLSNYENTDADATVKYTTNDWKPSFSPEIGFLWRIAKKSYFHFNIKYTIIPYLKPTTIEVKDNIGYTINYITQNPHGHQNNINISIGFLFQL
ncbi:MAG: hypothetical protein JW717_03235 [Marinilabiliaceae bacterium]|nr:hypothetical protein [Marinilabiliaceae bacterium]